MRGLLIAILCLGCGDSSSNGPKMAAAGEVGAACTADGDCKQTGATCVLAGTNNTWAGGYCTIKNCTTGSCPGNTYCQMGGTSLMATTCMYRCSTSDECRTGYACCAMSGGEKICLPADTFCK